MSDRPAIPDGPVETECRHMLVKTYSLPLKNWFRKMYVVRCWKCPIEIPGWDL